MTFGVVILLSLISHLAKMHSRVTLGGYTGDVIFGVSDEPNVRLDY